MAQSGYSVLSLYYSTTASAAPTAGNLVAGELAINTNDGILYYKDSSGVVQKIGTKGGVNGTSSGQVLFNNSGVIGGSNNLFWDITNGNLGIGTSSPSSKLSVAGIETLRTINDNGYISFFNSANTTRSGFIQGAVGAFAISADLAVPMTFQTSATERMRIDSSGNVGIGTSSPATKLDVKTAALAAAIQWSDNINSTGFLSTVTNGSAINSNTALVFGSGTSSPERMRIDSSGNLLVGTTTNTSAGRITMSYDSGSYNGLVLSDTATGTATRNMAIFNRNGTQVGGITTTNTLTVFATTSDYRLKTVIAPVSDAGTRIDALEPIEYEWKVGGRTRGFLAHKFAEVYPSSVSGEKDAVDEKGNPVYQSMQASTSEVMADLIAEIQSLRKRVAQLESK